MSEQVHKEPGFNFAHSMQEKVNPTSHASTSLQYRVVSRILNLVEDLHYQMQLPQEKRFKDYPIESYEEIDTFIRDNMANLALSLEIRAAAERGSDD